MATNVQRPEFWDDELEALSTRAAMILGEDAVSIAVERLFIQVRARQEAVSFPDFTAALKAELRRLVRPN